MMSYIIRVGDRFGRWQVTGSPVREKRGEGRRANYVLRYPCRCDCGTERLVRHFKLTSNSKSCGCLRDEESRERHTTHGDGRTRPRLYRVWYAMIQRCTNPRNSNYSRYGGRGITVCREWRESYAVFRHWATQHGYNESLQIDRSNNEAGYDPQNCQWVTEAQNHRNTAQTRLITVFGETKCLEDWARDSRCTVSPGGLRHRIIQLGWSPEKAVTTPRLTRRSAGPYITSHRS